MIIKANINGGYRDLLLGKTIEEGKIINELYEKDGVTLTEKRAKELVEKGIAVIVEDTVIINENNIVDPKEVEEGEAAEVEAEEVIIEDASAPATAENEEAAAKVEEGEEVKKNEVEEEK